jgi:hypothetical protein
MLTGGDLGASRRPPWRGLPLPMARGGAPQRLGQELLGGAGHRSPAVAPPVRVVAAKSLTPCCVFRCCMK